ncbi:MMPL family transporter [Okibacterium endophyticum]
MSSLLYSLGRRAYRARRLVVTLWILVLAAAGGAALAFNQGLDNAISIPGTESQAALDSLANTFPQVSGSSAQAIVVAPEGGSVHDNDIQDAVSSAVDDLNDIEQVAQATSPFDENITGAINDDEDAALISIQLDGENADITEATRSALVSAIDELNADLPDGAEAVLGGQLFSQNMPALSLVELVGVGVALVVLVLTFGSFLAAGMPLLTAMLGVGISVALLFFATLFGPITSTTPMLALMLGLAVGIDYALFIIARHQDQLRDGLEPEESAARAVATSGSAVIFAGLTVMIALLGLAVAGIPFLTVMGVWAAVAVAVAVLISITLIPAMLGFAGERLRPRPSKRSARRAAHHAARAAASASTDRAGTASTPPPQRNRFFTSWVKAVTRFPIVTILAVVAVLGLAAAPALGLKLALPDAGGLPEDDPARITYDLVSEHFGEGFNGPLIVTGSIVTSTDPVGLMDDLANEIEKLDGVDAVPLATPNETADTGIVQVIPEGGPDSDSTKALVNEIRDLHDHFLAEYDIDISVTGFTAVGIDVSDKLGAALLPFGLIVVGLSLILLTMVFRSVWVPIKATLGYLLSVAAAFGVVALVFEHGWFADALHVPQQGPVISFMPIILMGVLFGLAMDYEVFLVARMREDYVHSGDARHSIETGFVGSAKVVTAAAVIMFAVFAAFVPEGDVNIKPIALGLAVGVFVDAFVVRMTLVPAVLALLGEKAWWMPRWLDRALPSFDVEGEGLRHELELRDWPHPGSTSVIAAAGLTLDAPASAADAAPLYSDVSIDLEQGGTLIVRGEHRRSVTAMLLTLSGRLHHGTGLLKVTGLVLPVRAAAVRSRVAYADLGDEPVASVRRALAERPSVIVIDGIDAVADSASRRQIGRQLTAAQTWATARGRTLSMVIGTITTTPLDDVLPTTADAVSIDLADTAAQLSGRSGLQEATV